MSALGATAARPGIEEVDLKPGTLGSDRLYGNLQADIVIQWRLFDLDHCGSMGRLPTRI